MVTKSQSEAKPCAHHWVLGDPAGGAACKLCGRQRSFAAESTLGSARGPQNEVELLSLEALAELDNVRSEDLPWSLAAAW